MKHTKGPWIKEETDDTVFIFSPAGTGSYVCQIEKHGADGPMLAYSSNARLIAAAPELLEALEVALIGLLQVEDPLVETSDAIIAAKQAIAKAEGNGS